jgi:hypothetical protein
MAANFPRFMTIEEAAQLLGVSAARISMWIGECKLPVAARSEYAGFLLRTLTVETIARDLADALPTERDASLWPRRRVAFAGHAANQLVPRSPPASSRTIRGWRT